MTLSERNGTTTTRLYAYSVREFDGADGKKARSWTRIGVAFPHKDGNGFNIEVHSFPLDGRIVLFPADIDAQADHDDAGRETAEVPPPARPAAAAPGRNGQQPRRR